MGENPWDEEGEVSGDWTTDIEMTDEGPENIEELRRQWEERNKKQAGTTPGLIQRALAKLMAPKVNWKNELKRFITAISTRSEYFLPNRRFLGSGNVLWGSKKVKEGFDSLVIIVDTSGSMSEKALEQAISEAYEIVSGFNPKETYIIWFDTTVYTPVPIIKKGEKEKIKLQKAYGGGGTDFLPPYKWVEENIIRKNKKVGPVLFFTDGYPIASGWPTERDFSIKSYSQNVLWIITNRDYPNDDPSIVIPFGKRIDLVHA
jgi:predicted metal-dependent peptidase